MMFAGFGVTLRDLPIYLKWGSYVSYLRYGLEGYIGALFHERDQLACEKAMYCHYKYENIINDASSLMQQHKHKLMPLHIFSFRYPKKFLDEIAMESDQVTKDIVALLITFFGLRIICYYILKWRVVTNR